MALHYKSVFWLRSHLMYIFLITFSALELPFKFTLVSNQQAELVSSNLSCCLPKPAVVFEVHQSTGTKLPGTAVAHNLSRTCTCISSEVALHQLKAEIMADLMTSRMSIFSNGARYSCCNLRHFAGKLPGVTASPSLWQGAVLLWELFLLNCKSENENG